MPFTIDISPKEQIAYITGIGDISVPLCIETTANLVNHPDFQPHYGILLDSRQATNTPTVVETPQLAAVVHEYRDYFQGMTALVVNAKDEIRASTLCRLVRVFGVRMEAYSDTELAMQYLTTGQSG